MNIFEKHRFSAFAIGLLVIMNLALIAFIAFPYVTSTDNRFKERLGKDFISNKLNFSDEQKSQMFELRQLHRSEIRNLQREVNQKRQELFNLMKADDHSEEQIQIITDEIGMAVAEIEKSTFKHFSSIRALCTPEQLVIFDELLLEIAKRKGSGHREMRQRGQGKRNQSLPSLPDN